METITTENLLRMAPVAPIWALILVAAAMVYLLYSQVRSLKERLPGSRLPVLLSLLRLTAYSLILLLMLNPVVQKLSYLNFPPHVAVLVDDSVSMSVDDGGASRLDRVKAILSGAEWGRLTGEMSDYAFDYYSFGRRLEPIEPEEIEGLRANEEESNISLALQQVADGYSDEPLAGVVLFSDGKERAELVGGAIGAPVVAVGMGSGGGFRDIRISELRAPGFAFLHKPVNLDLQVRASGYGEAALSVIMRVDGKIVKTEEITVGEGEGGVELPLSFVPERLGQREVSVELIPRHDETVVENNRVEFVLPVERDKIRVLMISGRPSWNYRFLRQALKNDGSVDLISFIILRSPTDPVNVPQKQLSLIPFPANVLFTEELGNFDLIIFDNFAFRMNLPVKYMENLKNAVAEGGAFLMIGGDGAFYEGGYDGTPVEDILPVILDKKRAGYLPVRFPFILTEQGGRHPVMKVAGRSGSREAWAELPLLSGINRTLRARPGAVVLGVSDEGPSVTASLPVLAVTRFGEGRTAALLTDGLWRWDIEAAGRDKSNRLYLTMIKQLVRWLVRDPSLDQIKLSGNVVRQGDRGRFVLRAVVYHDDFSPAADAVINATVTHPTGETVPLDYLPGDRPGEYRAEMEAAEEGVYSFEAEARAGGELLGRSELKLEYTFGSAELRDAAPDEKLLETVAEATGGKYIEAGEFSSRALADIPTLFSSEPIRKLIERKVDPIFRNVYLFLALTSLLAFEWLIRRRRGLV